MGLFDNFLDFNNDGQVDSLEQAVGFGILQEMMDNEKKENIGSDEDETESEDEA